MALPVLVCMDEVPPSPGAACTTTAWIEQPTLIPTLSVADAQSLSMTALVAWVTVGAALLVRKAT